MRRVAKAKRVLRIYNGCAVCTFLVEVQFGSLKKESERSGVDFKRTIGALDARSHT